jgi:hypothetical protein
MFRQVAGSALVVGLALSGSMSVNDALANGVPDLPSAKGEVVVSFTKWFTPDGFPWMAGVVSGDLGNGTFAGEVIAFTDYAMNCSTPTPGCITFPIGRLDAIYQVQLGDRSFTALVRGGASDQTGIGTLNGAILDGWSTSASVHVSFKTISNCNGNPGGPCFRGTIRIQPNGADSSDR